MSKSKEGIMTLTEIMIVVAIISFLATIVLSTFSDYGKSESGNVIVNMTELENISMEKINE